MSTQKTYNILQNNIAIAMKIMNELPDSYEKGRLACAINENIIMQEFINEWKADEPETEIIKEVVEKTNQEVPVKLQDLNPAAPIADKISSVMNADTVEAIKQENNQAEKTAAPSNNIELPKTNASKQEIDWENKILNSDELDDTWTENMKKNKELMTMYNKMGAFIKGGLERKAFTMDWVNEKLGVLTHGYITHLRNMDDIPPKLIKAVAPALIKIFMEEKEKAKKSQGQAA